MILSKRPCRRSAEGTAVEGSAGSAHWGDVLSDHFLPNHQAPQVVEVELVTEAGHGRDRDGSQCGNLYGRHDDVACPVTLAGRDVAGERKAGERRERDIMRPADARF